MVEMRMKLRIVAGELFLSWNNKKYTSVGNVIGLINIDPVFIFR